MTNSHHTFELMDREAKLARVLRPYGIELFIGMTDLGIRRERARAGILQHGLESQCAFDFESIYGQPLMPHNTKPSIRGETDERQSDAA